MKTLRLFVIVLAALAATDTVSSAQRPPRPKLVVIVVVDQMRADYLERYPQPFKAGLRRLLDEGARFTNAAYPYANTITCAGHTTIGTGVFPYRHGMNLNTWYDRERNQSMECTDDPKTKEIGYSGLAGPGESARWIMAPTLAEVMRRDVKARAIGMSLKPRSSVTLVGHSADAVVWFDDRGGWATSTAYVEAPVARLKTYFEKHPLTADYGKTWDRLLDRSAYPGDDDAPLERPGSGWTRTFPHKLETPGGKPDAAFYLQWERSPFSNDYLEGMAEDAIDAWQLGRGPGVDFLSVSFSAIDLAGHGFGPSSHEVQDLVFRLDLTIGRLLDHLDKTLGKDGYVLALSSDHGVGEIPDTAKGFGRYGGREIGDVIDKALEPFFGAGKYFVFSASSDIYLSNGTLDRLKQKPQATRAVLDALRALPGIAFASLGDDLASPSLRKSKDPVVRAAALSHYPGRSGDIYLVPKEGWILSTSAATHGTPYSYDQRVPLIFFGAGVKAGTHEGPATPADLAPTLAKLAGVRFKTPDGHALDVR